MELKEEEAREKRSRRKGEAREEKKRRRRRRRREGGGGGGGGWEGEPGWVFQKKGRERGGSRLGRLMGVKREYTR